MINDAIVPVSCDTCHETIEIQPEYKYTDWSGRTGYYDTKESSLEKLIEDEGWFVDHGKHYCCEGCVPMPEAK